MIYFPPYILLWVQVVSFWGYTEFSTLVHSFSSEVPGNLVLRWIGARSWITICVVGWGAAQIGMAFVPSWGLLCLTRVLLGMFEVRLILCGFAWVWISYNHEKTPFSYQIGTEGR